MKSKIATIILSLTSIAGFCAEFSDSTITNPLTTHLTTDVNLPAKAAPNRSFGYVRLGVSDRDATKTFETIPGLGLGYRYGIDHAAIDVSASYTSQISGAQFAETYFYTLPKVSYLRYFGADSEGQSFYYGAGLAFGGLKKTADSAFTGLIPNATVGYEMNRGRAFCSFVQLDVSQPATSFSRSHKNLISFANLPGPLAEMSVGVGY